MGNFLLHYLLPFCLFLSILSLVHCAVKRNGVAWGLVIIFLGPLGWLMYLAGLKNWLPFSGPLRALNMEATSTRRCPSCQKLAPVLYPVDDGRKVLQLCQMCKAELDLRRSNFDISEL